MSSSGKATNNVASPLAIQGATNTGGIDVDAVANTVRLLANGVPLASWATGTKAMTTSADIQPPNSGVYNCGLPTRRWINVYANGVVFPLTTQTGTAYTLGVNDNLVIINNAAGATVTLFDPTTGTVGREYTIKNINLTAVTVATAAGTIDGAATVTLNQWQRIQVVSDGTQWLIVST